MPVGDQPVLQVPHQVRQVQQDREAERQQRPPSVDAPPGLGAGGEEEREADREHRHRIFGEQAEADRKPEQTPPLQPAVAGEADAGIERRRPEQEEERIGRDQQRGEEDRRQGDVEHRRPGADPGSVKGGAGGIEQEGGRGMGQWRGDAHAEGAVAEQVRAGADDPGDQRRLRVVAEVGAERPHPVLRLVAGEVEPVEGEQDETRQRDRGDHRSRDQDRGDGRGGCTRHAVVARRSR